MLSGGRHGLGRRSPVFCMIAVSAGSGLPFREQQARSAFNLSLTIEQKAAAHDDEIPVVQSAQHGIVKRRATGLIRRRGERADLQFDPFIVSLCPRTF